MIKKLFLCGCFDYKKFIIDNMTALKLKPMEAIILIIIIENIQNNKKVFLNGITSIIDAKKADVDDNLTSLIERHFFDIYIQKNDKGLDEELISIDGFFEHVKNILSNNDDNIDELGKILKLVQAKFNRVLTANEIEIITSLVKDDKYNFDDFTNAVMKNNKKVINIKTIVSALSENEAHKEVNNSNTLLKSFMKDIK